MKLAFNPLSRETNFALLGTRRLTLVLSALLVLASLALIVRPGLNLGVDFIGGAQITIANIPEGSNLIQMQDTLRGIHPTFGDIDVQAFDAGARFLIPRPDVADLPQGVSESAYFELREIDVRTAFDIATDDPAVSLENIGGQVSGEQQRSAIIAVVVALLAIAFYIALRFEWRFSVAALIALMHDALTTIGLFVILGLEVNLEVVAAVLTIAGYSINDTVVVFDRIREEMRLSSDEPLLSILSRSLNRTLSRTLMTSVTTMLALLMLFYFAGADLLSFSVALIWGVIIGTYSSIFLATPLLQVFGLSTKVFERKQADVGEIEDGALAWASSLEDDPEIETLDGGKVTSGTAPKRVKGKPRKGKR